MLQETERGRGIKWKKSSTSSSSTTWKFRLNYFTLTWPWRWWICWYFACLILSNSIRSIFVHAVWIFSNDTAKWILVLHDDDGGAFKRSCTAHYCFISSVVLFPFRWCFSLHEGCRFIISIARDAVPFYTFNAQIVIDCVSHTVIYTNIYIAIEALFELRIYDYDYVNLKLCFDDRRVTQTHIRTHYLYSLNANAWARWE